MLFFAGVDDSGAQPNGLLPPHWGKAITLDELPRAGGPGGPAIIAPWDYLQRLGALKSLVQLTQAQMPCLYQGNVEENILVRDRVTSWLCEPQPPTPNPCQRPDGLILCCHLPCLSPFPVGAPAPVRVAVRNRPVVQQWHRPCGTGELVG